MDALWLWMAEFISRDWVEKQRPKKEQMSFQGCRNDAEMH